MNIVNQIRYELSIDPHSSYIDSLPYWKIAFIKAFSVKKSSPSTGSTRSVDTDVKSNFYTSKLSEVQEFKRSNTSIKLDMSGEIPISSLIMWILALLFVILAGIVIEIFLIAPAIDESIYSSLACKPQMMYARYIFQTTILVFTVGMLYTIRDVEDSMNLRNEIMVSSIVNITIYTYYLLLTLVPHLAFLKGEVGGGVLGVIGVFTQHCVTVIWPLFESFIFSRNVKLIQARFKTGQMNMESMMIVLNNHEMMFDFKKELMGQFCIENGIFYEEFNKIQKRCKRNAESSTSILDTGKEMRMIRSVFIESGSPQELNIPHKLKKTYLDLLDGGSVNFEILVPIKDEVLKMMVIIIGFVDLIISF